MENRTATMREARLHQFLATVYKIWMMRYIDVPEDVSSALMKETAKARRANERTRANRSGRQQDEAHGRGRLAAKNKASKPRAGARGRSGALEHSKRAARKNAGNDGAKPKYIPVTAIVNGRSARVTLVPAGGGRFRVQINTALRKAARVDVGDVVGVGLRLDLESRELPVPPDLRNGLKAIPKARRAFDALAPGHRRHFIEWFDSAKSPAARQRRLERAIDVLLERALLKP